MNMQLMMARARINHAFSVLALSGTFAAGTIGAPYSSDLTISGGNGVYSNPRVTAGSLPAGLSLSIVSGTLVMSGTPTATASSSFTVAVDSADGQTAYSTQIGAIAAATGRAYYRIYITANNGGSYTAIGKLILRTVAGGPQAANVVVGYGNAYASSAYTGASPGNAFATSPTDYWVTDGTTGSQAPCWLEFYFQDGTGLPNPVTIVEYAVQFVPGGVEPVNEAPKNWTLQKSSNGTSWTTVDTRTSQTGWSSGQSRTFTVATP